MDIQHQDRGIEPGLSGPQRGGSTPTLPASPAKIREQTFTVSPISEGLVERRSATHTLALHTPYMGPHKEEHPLTSSRQNRLLIML